MKRIPKKGRVVRTPAPVSKTASDEEIESFLRKRGKEELQKIAPLYAEAEAKAIEKAELDESILEEVKTELTPLIRQVSAIDGKYLLSDKAVALMFLEYTVTDSDRSGEYKPRFSLCSQALSIPEKTLRDWWQQKDKIRKIVGHTIDNLPSIISTKLKFINIQVLDELERRGMETFTNKELFLLLEKSIKITRLLDGKSTENFAHSLAGMDSHVGKE